ncbi:10376_t:CDS:2 [Gigaspora margarita]|uniref:10376_t:CDS:1 n=1 Tax=Gigaspora margarita TaxID=4874 RepID=A0ABN7V9G2_GIGMA|nr:10376_t:CDS:2 [Gigaspora margarita]
MNNQVPESTETNNASGCLYVDIITSAQNNKVTNDATKLAEIEEIVDLASHIKENDSTNLIAEEEVLEEKNAESDPGVVLENLIDDYLEVIKVDQKKEMKRKNVPVGSGEVVDDKPEYDKQDKEKEKKSNCRHTVFEKSFDGLDKILEVEPINARALVNKENKEKSVNETQA